MKRTFRHSVSRWSLFLLLAALFGSCGDDDDYVYPSVLSELVEGYVNNEHLVDRITTDDGTTWMLENTLTAEGYTTDSIYRFYCMYDLTDGNKARVYRLRNVCSSLPQPAQTFTKGVKRDPLSIQSIWRGSSYLNIIALPMIQSIPHTYGFVEDSVIQSPDRTTKVYLSLYHSQNEDVEAYEEKTYLSIPLKQYGLNEGDSIIFRATTYKEGVKTWKFGY